jgi:uncharacterized protein YkwD/uncharacterized membrane protein required for colicin V production
MIDFLLGMFLAALLVRGWLRGFVREALDLAGPVLGVLVAFRLAAPLGDELADRFGMTPEWSRLGAGVALFIAVGVVMTVIAHYLGKMMRLPGLTLVNRFGGSVVAAAWGVVIVLVAVTVLRAFDPPEALESTLDESTVVASIAGPGAMPQQVFQQLAGDEVLDSLLALREGLGARRVVLEEGDTIAIEPASPGDLESRPDDAADVYARLNMARAAAGVDPLAWSDALAEVGRRHALDMYVNGFFSHTSPTTGTVADRVRQADLRLTRVGENLALAASSRAVHDGLMESPSHRENMLRGEYDVVGIAAVRGPSGLMVVQVFGDR